MARPAEAAAPLGVLGLGCCAHGSGDICVRVSVWTLGVLGKRRAADARGGPQGTCPALSDAAVLCAPCLEWELFPGAAPGLEGG